MFSTPTVKVARPAMERTPVLKWVSRNSGTVRISSSRSFLTTKPFHPTNHIMEAPMMGSMSAENPPK